MSTPEHVRSFVGRFIYIYTSKGELKLSPQTLTYSSRATTLDIPLSAISTVQIGHYSRWAKPFRLDYIAITFRDGHSQKSVLLTPTSSPGWCVACWETNKIVASWAEDLKEAIRRHLASS
jgi:hypothetical protein